MQVGGNKIKHSGELTRKFAILITVLMLIICLIIFLIFSKKQTERKTLSVCANQSNRAILVDAANYLNPIQSIKLYDVTKKIVKLNNFIHDPNCDYIMMSYYLGYDYTSAQYFYNQLTKYYVPKVGYSPIISGKVLTFSELQTKLNQAKSVDNEIKNNTLYVTGKSR